MSKQLQTSNAEAKSENSKGDPQKKRKRNDEDGAVDGSTGSVQPRPEKSPRKGSKHDVLPLPPELRLEVYDHVLPFRSETEAHHLRLVSRKTKDEFDYEVAKDLRKLKEEMIEEFEDLDLYGPDSTSLFEASTLRLERLPGPALSIFAGHAAAHELFHRIDLLPFAVERLEIYSLYNAALGSANVRIWERNADGHFVEIEESESEPDSEGSGSDSGYEDSASASGSDPDAADEHVAASEEGSDSRSVGSATASGESSESGSE
jgi:hypothetical protein